MKTKGRTQVATELYIPNRTHELGVRSVDRRIHLRLRIPTEISGTDLCGQDFVESTSTVLVAPSGAIVECTRALGPDQEVSLKVGKKEALARVLGQAGLSESKYVYGVSFLKPDASFWGVCFPANAGAEHRLSANLIECGRCSIQRMYVLNEIESLVATASRSFGLYCPGCKDSTLWKLAADRGLGQAMPYENRSAKFVEVEVPPSEIVPLAGALIERTPKKGGVEGRKHRRVAMPRSKACVQMPNKEEETVELLNVSKGGASFRSSKIYSLGCWIRIAAPCTVGAANIFVLGRVVRVACTESGREYGVEYVETN